jgi:Fis family transcriptional regulator
MSQLAHTVTANMGLPATVVPFKRPEQSPEFCLSAAADKCLTHYFKQLHGTSPAPELHTIIMSEVERPLIQHVLHYARGNQLRAAEILGLNRNTLRKKIRELGIDVKACAQRQ